MSRWNRVRVLIGLASAACFLVFLGRCTPGKDYIGAGDVEMLYLIPKNFGLNSFLMRDVFDQYGWHVTVVGVEDSITACPPVYQQLGIHPVLPDFRASDIGDVMKYDCLVIPPGSGSYYPVPDPFADLLGNAYALRLIREAAEADLPVYATCAGVHVLAEADLIRGRRVGGSPRFEEKYIAAGAVYVGRDHPPVIDGNIITSARGLYYNVINCQAIATALEDRGRRGTKNRSRKKTIVQGSADFDDEGIAWAWTYGGPDADGARALCETEEGGLLLVGYSFSHGQGDADVLVIKTDAEGKMLWHRTYGGRGTEYGYGCTPVDGGVLVVGYTTSFGAGSKDVYVLRLDGEGNEVWARTYGGSSWDVGHAVCATDDDGILVCGFTHSSGAGEEDVYLIKLDGDGNLCWSQTYGGERFEMGHSVHALGNGQIAVGAVTGTYGKGNCDAYLILTDSQGNEVWSKSYGTEGRRGYGFDWCNSMHPSEDGGFILTGSTDCRDIQDAHVVRTDENGEQLWTASIGQIPFYDYGNTFIPMHEGEGIVVGTTKVIVGDARIYDNDVLVAKLDTKGGIEWMKFPGTTGSDWASACVRRDGNLIIIGHTDSGGRGSFDAFMMKLGIE